MKMPTDAIREEIQRDGEISFARFMELALYCPETGYYETQKDIVGRSGDFITSVSAGSLFGELLAFQFAEWLEALPAAKRPLQLVEAGAHDGKLAADILNWLQLHRPKLFGEIEYCILEPSASRQTWQRKTLARFANVAWLAPEHLNARPPVCGIIFSNELLDAFPVRRWGWNAQAGKWFEWGVTWQAEQFCWTKMRAPQSPLPSALLHLPPSLLAVLPDGYVFESSPAAENWWRQTASALARGKLVAIDYGFAFPEQFSPARLRGTLRAYRRHQVSDDLLASPGEQDLTAHVDFSAMQQTGEAAGLKTEMFCPQPQFLTRIFSRAMKENSFTKLDASRIRQFQTLTHPEHLGRAFRVLVQGR
jgi:SAM-dependent MidA family methyltransferase